MLLSLETSTTVCSVALSEGERIVSFREINEGFSHAGKLTVFITEVLEEAREKLKNLEAVAVSCGPGSYTGLRIGVSVAKGLCFAGDIPLIGIPTLEALASGTLEGLKSNDGKVLFCPMIDARRMEVYCALYDGKRNILQPATAEVVTRDLFSGILEAGQYDSVYFFGDGAEKCRELLKEPYKILEGRVPSARFIATLADKKLKAGEFENLALFEPFYLKEFRAGVKSPGAHD